MSSGPFLIERETPEPTALGQRETIAVVTATPSETLNALERLHSAIRLLWSDDEINDVEAWNDALIAFMADDPYFGRFQNALDFWDFFDRVRVAQSRAKLGAFATDFTPDDVFLIGDHGGQRNLSQRALGRVVADLRRALYEKRGLSYDAFVLELHRSLYECVERHVRWRDSSAQSDDVPLAPSTHDWILVYLLRTGASPPLATLSAPAFRRAHGGSSRDIGGYNAPICRSSARRNISLSRVIVTSRRAHRPRFSPCSAPRGCAQLVDGGRFHPACRAERYALCVASA